MYANEDAQYITEQACQVHNNECAVFGPQRASRSKMQLGDKSDNETPHAALNTDSVPGRCG